MTFRKAEADTLKCCSREITGVTHGINNGSGPFRCSGNQGQSSIETKSRVTTISKAKMFISEMFVS